MAELASWWLKVRRADKHMVDIKREARYYASLDPYEFTRVREPDTKLDVRYKVRITEQPDPSLALMLGDFFHNLRSALDHVVVASIPKAKQSESTGYPFTSTDLWRAHPNPQVMANLTKARDDFERRISGIDPRARAFIISSQPYHLGKAAERSTLGLISRIDNADKHRQLAAVGGGIRRVSAGFTMRGLAASVRRDMGFGVSSFAKDDTLVGWQLPKSALAVEPPLKPSEVDMKFRGAAVIFIKIATGGKGRDTYFPLYLTINTARQEIRRVLKALEPYTIS